MKTIAIISFWLFCMPVNGHKSLFILSLEDFDRRVNTWGAKIFNRVLIEKDGYKFGDPRESISSVIGKNNADGTLSSAGKIVDGILNMVQKDHSIINIQNF